MVTTLAVYVGEILDVNKLGAYSIFIQFFYGDRKGIRHIYVLPSSVCYKFLSLGKSFKEIHTKQECVYAIFETKLCSVKELEEAFPMTEVIPIDVDKVLTHDLAKGF
jgi:hypothetical protein